jgi:hypothetical protein
MLSLFALELGSGTGTGAVTGIDIDIDSKLARIILCGGKYDPSTNPGLTVSSDPLAPSSSGVENAVDNLLESTDPVPEPERLHMLEKLLHPPLLDSDADRPCLLPLLLCRWNIIDASSWRLIPSPGVLVRPGAQTLSLSLSPPVIGSLRTSGGRTFCVGVVKSPLCRTFASASPIPPTTFSYNTFAYHGAPTRSSKSNPSAGGWNAC